MALSWGQGLREIIAVSFRNVLMAALVFVPVLFLMIPLNLMLLGGSPEGGVPAFIAFVLFFYLSAAVPGIMGSVVHSIAVILIPWGWPRRRRQFATVLLSPLLPATMLMYRGLDRGNPVRLFWVATIIATVAYGLCSSFRLPQINKT